MIILLSVTQKKQILVEVTLKKRNKKKKTLLKSLNRLTAVFLVNVYKKKELYSL